MSEKRELGTDFGSVEIEGYCLEIMKLETRLDFELARRVHDKFHL